MSLFDDLLYKAKQLVSLPRHSDSVVGIDVGASAIKIVQLKRKDGRVILETYGELSLGSYQQKSAGEIVPLDPQIVVQAITDILREANVTTKDALFSIQSQATLIFTLSLPHVSDSELAQIIPNEARRYIPVPLTEVSLDWYQIPQLTTYEAEESQKDKDKMEAVVVAVRNETLSQYKQLGEGAKLALLGEEIEIFSAIRSLFHREITPTLVIDYGANTTKVSIVEYGVVRAYHVINRGGAFVTESIMRSQNVSFAEAEQMKKTVTALDAEKRDQVLQTIHASSQYVINEIQSVVLQYEKQNQKVVTKIFLIGGSAYLDGFKKNIEETFGVETLFGDPFDKTDAPEFMRPVLKQAGPEFAVAIGLALKNFL